MLRKSVFLLFGLLVALISGSIPSDLIKEDLLLNWQELKRTYIKKSHNQNSLLILKNPITIIGGCASSGIERILDHLRQSSHIIYTDLGSRHWNFSSHVRGNETVSSLHRHLLATVSSAITANKQVVIIDDTGFDFLLEISAIFSSHVTATIEYFLVVTEPEIFMGELRSARNSFCETRHRLSSPKLNASNPNYLATLLEHLLCLPTHCAGKMAGDRPAVGGVLRSDMSVRHTRTQDVPP